MKNKKIVFSIYFII